MKKQETLGSFFTKKPKLEQQQPSELALDNPKPSQAPPLPPFQLGESSKSSIESPESKIEINFNVQQLRNFQEKYEGLEVSNKKLGCKYCAKHDFAIENGVHVSNGWKHFTIKTSGKNKVQQVTLREKMGEHFTLKAHTICTENKGSSYNKRNQQDVWKKIRHYL